VAATGAGKTVVFSYIARNAAAKGNRVLILAHRDTLIKQASRKLNDYGVQHGIIMAGFSESKLRKVQVASVQTLIRRLKHYKPDAFDLIVIDEAHLSAAKSYVDIVNHFSTARVLGVTGSPIRLDGKGLGVSSGGLFEELVMGISIGELIQQCYLVRPTVFAARIEVDLSEVKKVGGDYESESLAAVMDTPKITGSAIENWKRICPGVPAVAWCANVAHAKHVAEEFIAAGIPALCLSGESTPEERDAALRRLEDGTLKIITFAMLLVEGVDCPAIGAVILLRPTMSLSSYLQVIGRGLRTIYAKGFDLETTEGRRAAIMAGPKGDKCFVLDHAGMTMKHGFADDDREWSLEGIPKKKGKKKDEKPLDVAQCPVCFMVHAPAPVCPNPLNPATGKPCGHVYVVKVRKLEYAEGDLQEITPEMRAALAAKRKTEVKSKKTLEELKAYGALKGYSQGWALQTFNAKKRTREKYLEEPKLLLNSKTLADILTAIRARNTEWRSLAGFSIAELMTHLDAQFEDGMSWDNLGEWEIAHIAPASDYQFSGSRDQGFKDFWSLNNIKPVWVMGQTRSIVTQDSSF